ncbi:MAG: hypothetical protein JWN33_95 [Candidatus Saccharibacteria bacterium]|nr:hypothetical protein [Candidatus Saccharibacteria bacterium]
MSEVVENEFIDNNRDIDSPYWELYRSSDYADEELYSTDRLWEIGRYWKKELDAPDPRRSERSIQEIESLVNRIVFEIEYRKRDFKIICEQQLADVALVGVRIFQETPEAA